ncbi:hypothetical protein T492DRAFT_885926 [Pavlovales sp. CCMP2436]|nr:hypothetical protein T492DRAFT_885926 [Pavlovales sp. CCMP2436]
MMALARKKWETEVERTAERDDAREAADIAIDIADNLRAEAVAAEALATTLAERDTARAETSLAQMQLRAAREAMVERASLQAELAELVYRRQEAGAEATAFSGQEFLAAAREAAELAKMALSSAREELLAVRVETYTVQLKAGEEETMLNSAERVHASQAEHASSWMPPLLWRAMPLPLQLLLPPL